VQDAPEGAEFAAKSEQFILGVKANVHHDVVEASDDGEKLHLFELGQFLGDSLDPTGLYLQIYDGGLGRGHLVGVDPGLKL